MHVRLTSLSLTLAALMALSTVLPAAAAAPYSERHRPQFHFTPARDWMNDPNGLVYFDGEYHLFFQRSPGSREAKAGTLTWGHAVGTDLVRWRQLPDAIEPDAAGDAWSGSAVVDWQNTSGFGAAGGKPPLVALYTAARDPFAQHLVYSNDRGRTWTKFAGNPVLRNINAHNRDPKVVWHAPTKRWVMALYLDKPNAFALFASPDLKAWTALQEFTLDGDNECPDFFPIDLDGDATRTKWVFMAANNRYVVGSFDGKTFTPETDSLPSEHGPNFYAAQTFSDLPNGRRVQIGWMRGGNYPDMPFNQQMSFPSELTLRTTPRGPRLFRTPVKEIESLYAGRKLELRDTTLPADHDLLDAFKGELFDIDAEIEPGSAKSVTLTVRGLPISFHAEGAGGALTCWDRRVTLTPQDGRIKLRVLVDRTSVEIFANDGAVVLSGCFLPPDDQRAVTLTAAGGSGKAVKVTVRELKSAWVAADQRTAVE
jgi:sucrose-6-phosphate hydrolase SacC (GH32 family)